MKTDSTGQAVHKDVLQSQYKAWKGHTWGELWLDYVPINGITYTTIQKFGVSRMFSLCLPKATFIESKYIRNSNTVKYNYILKLFSILIHFKM